MKLVKYSLVWLGLLVSMIMLGSAPISAKDKQNSQEGKNEFIRLNPEYKIKQTSNGDVIIMAKDQEGEVKHQFSDFYADLLVAASRRQGIENITETLRKKYFLTKDDCRRELKHALNTLLEWNIILREDQT